MKQQLTEAKDAIIGGDNKGRRFVQVALAMVGVLMANGKTMPGYTPAVYSVEHGMRALVTEAYWAPWPTLFISYLGVIAVGLTAWANWKPNGKAPS